MANTDPIADFLTRIRNAISASHVKVEIPASRLKQELARVLKEQGYIESYSVQPAPAGTGGETLLINLKYVGGRSSAIAGLRRVSRPGRRDYTGAEDVPKVLGGMGIAIISTSKGLMTGHQARKQGIGGEVLAEVW